MKPEHDQATTSRWILYHGTSSYRLDQILRANRLNPSQIGPETRQVSLTPERSVAEYFACNAVLGDALGDEHDHPHVETEPVVLVLDGEGLVALHCTILRVTGATAKNVTGKTRSRAGAKLILSTRC